MCKEEKILKFYTTLDKYQSYFENDKKYKPNFNDISLRESVIDYNKVSEFEDYITLIKEINLCKKCILSETRKNVVVGEGDLNADVIFIGEGPGEQEDLTGRPFVGRAGKLLDKYLNSFEIDRKRIYITNIVKCRPPNNRNPQLKEAISCFPFLKRQIDYIKPKLIIGLGLVSTQFILETKKSLTKIRGKFYRINRFGTDKEIYFYATYHPSALLRNINLEKFAIEDFTKIVYFCKKMGIRYK